MAQTQLGALVFEIQSAERSAHGIWGDLHVKFSEQMSRQGGNRPAREPVAQIAWLRQDRLAQTCFSVGIDGPRAARALSHFQAAEAETSVIVEPALHRRGMFPQAVANL
jgi:hypothetical protein